MLCVTSPTTWPACASSTPTSRTPCRTSPRRDSLTVSHHQPKCTRQLVSARLAGRVQGVSAALFALCRSLFRPKFVWGSLAQVPKEWLGTRCAKSPNKSLLLFSRAWGRPAWVRRQLEQLPLLPLGDCRGDQHGARALRPRPGRGQEAAVICSGLSGWLLRNGVQEHLSVFAQGFGGGASEGRLAACVYICNNKVLCLATCVVCGGYAQPYLPQVCFLVWKFFPCRSKISPCTSTTKSFE